MHDSLPGRTGRPPLLHRLDANHYSNRPDFLLRVANMNRLENVAALSMTLNLSYETLVMASSDDLNRHMHGSTTIKNARKKNVVSRLQQRAVARRRRICPQCVSEDRSHAVSFNFAVPVPCPYHDCIPVDVCQNCEEFIDYFKCGLKKCFCGFRLSASRLVRTPRSYKEFYDKAMRGNWACGPETIVDMAFRHLYFAHDIEISMFGISPLARKPSNAYIWISLRHLPDIVAYLEERPMSRASDGAESIDYQF